MHKTNRTSANNRYGITKLDIEGFLAIDDTSQRFCQRSRKIIDFIRNKIDISRTYCISGDFDVFSKTTIVMMSNRFTRVAKILMPGQAVRALSTANARSDNDTITNLIALNTLANFFDYTCNFMAKHDRRFDCLMPETVSTKITATNCASFDFNEEFTHTSMWFFHIFDFNIFNAFINSCSHKTTPFLYMSYTEILIQELFRRISCNPQKRPCH